MTKKRKGVGDSRRGRKCGDKRKKEKEERGKSGEGTRGKEKSRKERGTREKENGGRGIRRREDEEGGGGWNKRMERKE